jgi:hypothetical protein
VLRRLWIELASTTVVASPVVIVIGVLVARTNTSWLEPYWLDVSSKATGSFIVLAPALAALSAWDASRWRVLSVLPVRGTVHLLARHLLVVAGITLVTFGVSAVLMVSSVRPSAGAPRWDVLATGTWMVVAYAASGFALGHLLPRTVAAPLAFAAVWVWVAYTPAVQPFWLRNANGNLAASCCTLDTELVEHALSAPALIGGALVLGSVLVLRRPRAVLAWLASMAAVTGAVVVASVWLADVGADPVRARDGQRDCVSGSATTLCAWPEHASRLEAGADELSAAASRLRSAGLDVPRTLEEGARTADGGWTFSLSGPSVDTWVATLATSPLATLPPPCIDHNGGLWPAGEKQPLVTAWLESVVHTGPVARVASDAGADRDELDRLLARSGPQQLAWYTATRAALEGCEPLP